MDSTRRKWTFSLLWTNLAVAVVVLILLLDNQISSVRKLLNVLAYALIYANLVMLLGLFLLGALSSHSTFGENSLPRCESPYRSPQCSGWAHFCTPRCGIACKSRSGHSAKRNWRRNVPRN